MHPTFKDLADIFLVDGKKVINVPLLSPYFTPISLAY